LEKLPPHSPRKKLTSETIPGREKGNNEDRLKKREKKKTTHEKENAQKPLIVPAEKLGTNICPFEWE